LSTVVDQINGTGSLSLAQIRKRNESVKCRIEKTRLEIDGWNTDIMAQDLQHVVLEPFV